MNSKILLWLYERGKRDFTGTRIHQAKLKRSNLRFACFSRSKLVESDLSGALLIGADFIYANLQSVDLSDANCMGANFLAANLRRANLARTVMSGAIFTSANLSQANLEEASLTGAELRATNLRRANLRNANLQGANLRAANLYQADLTGANLEGADLSGAIMPDAEFEEAIPAPPTDPTPDPKTLKTREALEGFLAKPAPIQVFEAIPIVHDPDSGAANQKAVESAWGTDLEADLEDDRPRDSMEPEDGINRWQTMLYDGFTQAFQLKNEEEAKNRLSRSLLIRKGQPQLRMQVLQAYSHRCALSRCNVEDVLEVAYIIPFLGDKTNNLENLLLLRSDLHVLFDLHLLSVDIQDNTFHVAPWLKDTYYSILEGRPLYIPPNQQHRPDPDLLRS